MFPCSIRAFCKMYGISRPRLTRIIENALRDHSGVFAIQGYGYFKAGRPGPDSDVEIDAYYPTKAEQEAIPPLPPTGNSVQQTQPAEPALRLKPESDPTGLPSEHELKLRIMQERANALKQKNILEQARIREETVSYCSSVIQIILTSLRQEIALLRLTPAVTDAMREAISTALSDLEAVIPDIIKGTPADKIELILSGRRADRIAASRSKENTEEKP